MATQITVRLEGGAKLKAALAKLNPEQNHEIFIRSAREVAVKIAANARNVQIRRGLGAVHPTQLTNRTFHLRNSIGPDFSGFPKYAEVGTDVFYGAIHEFGLGIRARPVMQPALESIRPEIPGIVVRNWKRVGGV